MAVARASWSARFVTAISACNHKTIRLKEAGPDNPSAGVERERRTMFAVIKTGGKQYRVAEDQVLKIEKIEGEPGEIVQLGDVLMLGGDTPTARRPDGRGRQRRRRGRRAGPRPEGHRLQEAPPQELAPAQRGHRQEFTLIRITRDPDRRQVPDQGREAEARAQGRSRPPMAKAEAKPTGKAARPRCRRPGQGQGRGQEAEGQGQGEDRGKEKVTEARLRPSFSCAQTLRERQVSIFVR